MPNIMPRYDPPRLKIQGNRYLKESLLKAKNKSENPEGDSELGL